MIEASFAKSKKKKITISGYVLDVANKPIEGVSIVVDNAKSSVTTNRKGFYKIRIKPDTKSIIAFSPERGGIEVAFTGLENVNFVFFETDTDDAKYLSTEFVEELIAQNMKEIEENELSNNNFENIYQMISCKLPGVVVKGRSITIRGPSSINAQHNPLFVVDGRETFDIDDINPRDVKSISVINSSAAAIYGSRGGMGVIVITLKKFNNK